MSRSRRAPRPKIGKPLAYDAMPFGNSAVDQIAERLGHALGADCREVSVKLRNAILAGHAAGIARWVAYRDANIGADAYASLTAIRRLSAVLRTDPELIPELSRGIAVCDAENPMFGDWARNLVQALDRVDALESVIADCNAAPPLNKRSNPGKLYLRGMVSRLVLEWRGLTGSLPARRPGNIGSQSTRAIFHDFLRAALADLGLDEEPPGELVRDAVDRIERGEPAQ